MPFGGVRGRAAAHVGGRIDQQLVADRQVAGVARGDRDDRRQVAAGTVAADREAIGIEAECGGLLAHPPRCRDAVVDGRGKTVLGRHPIVHRNDRAAGAIGQLAAQRVVGVEVTDDPAAAVKVDQDRQSPAAVADLIERPVQPNWNRAVRAVGPQVENLADCGPARAA